MLNMRLIQGAVWRKRARMLTSHKPRSRVGGVLGLAAGMLVGSLAQAQFETPEDEASREVRFAKGLIGFGFPDYADKIVDRLAEKFPAAKPQVSAVKIKVLTARGKFDDAEALIKTLPAEGLESLAMTLSLADDFYAWGKMQKAKEYYEAFFRKFPKGPPPELKQFYAESAYRYAQMMAFANDTSGAAQAYRYVLLSDPEPGVGRTVMTELAELLLKMGEKAKPEDRKKYFAECKELCAKVQWGGTDVAFGKTVVILAHLAMLEGDAAGARKIIADYLPMLKEIDALLKETPDGLRYSPMAECKFMLGALGEDELKALAAAPDAQASRDKVVELARQTLGNYYTVLINYASSSWASEAGRRGDALATFLSDKGFKVSKLPREKLAQVVDVLMKEARLAFQNQDFKSAIGKYRAILNTFPDIAGAVPALGDMVRSYVNLRDFLAAKAVTGYMAERYGRGTPEQVDEAGNAMLAIAAEYEAIGDKGAAGEVNQLFFTAFPSHRRAAASIFKDGEKALREENYPEAMKYYRRIVDEFSRELLYVDALSRLAYCHAMTGAHGDAVPLLQKYVEALKPSPEQLSARMRLADAYRQLDQTVAALNEYARVVKLMTEEPAKFGMSADDAAKNAKTLERALFWRPMCYSRLRQPEAQVPLYQTKAIEGFAEFIAKYPKSDLAPSALSTLGSLYVLQNKPEDAEKMLSRLAKEYPDSEQAKNVTFFLADSLVKIGQREKAAQVFERMLQDAAKFKPSQFLQAATFLGEAGMHETAIKFHAQAAASPERAIWEPAMMGLGNSHVALGNYSEAIKVIEALLAKYPNSGFTVNASFLLSRCYIELAAKETAQARRDEHCLKAIGVMKTLLKFIREPGERARADYQVAHIHLLGGHKEEALAAFARILLLTDPTKPKVGEWYEKAAEEGIPLMLEMNRASDALDGCEAYLKAMPQGRIVDTVRGWRDQAKVRLVTSGAAAGAK